MINESLKPDDVDDTTDQVCNECGIELSDRGRGERAKGRTDLCKECAFYGEELARMAPLMPREFPLAEDDYAAAMVDAGRGHLLRPEQRQRADRGRIVA